VLIRANPENPASTTDFVCDVCTAIPEPTDGGRTYTFTIRDDVRFEDGSVLTAYDVAASWNKIVAPPEGVISARQGYYSMVDKVEALDLKTIVFRLKFATAAFIPAIADPYAFIYKKDLLDRDPHWFEKNIMGSGPFRFKEYQAGQSISGVRNPDYYRPGLPYLDGFTGIFADKQAVRVSRNQERSRGDRVPRLSAVDPRRTRRHTRLGDHRAGERLELRQPDHPEPPEESRLTMSGCAAL
jgi:peptide/nickel transport system substrate-binding protein